MNARKVQVKLSKFLKTDLYTYMYIKTPKCNGKINFIPANYREAQVLCISYVNNMENLYWRWIFCFKTLYLLDGTDEV